MTNPDDAAGVTLATIRAYLGAAEAALADGTPPDPVAACESALAELRRAGAAHDRFVWEMSHDLRNNFTAITGQAQLLERSLDKGTISPDRVRKAVQQINQSIAEASAIVEKLTSP
jgi:signal transduction histidine kinase